MHFTFKHCPKTHRHVLRSLLAMTGLFVSIGCDHEPDYLHPGEAVSITILSGGQPVPAGQLNLSGQGGGATLDPQGVASLEHVPYGTYQVTLLPPEVDPVPPEPGSAPSAVATPTPFPKKFASAKTTPLSITVAEGTENSFTLDIKE
ncbi:hypothetical protein Poly24_45460 [Rosistilla carotiformis]|uniref:Uncharacterized protein n=1 Tax=Rosistilla carotiformis TaxID=2528017 RepID=A0A518JZ50_9BACT|nr:DUF4382 domain-containing protein [Rosistilla carotiformis]QDV70813.1 hypothetical protein Poly24_45460 [Rosistilla carotiformis]